MNRYRTRVVLGVVLAWWALLPTAGQDKAPQPLPQKVGAAWMKAGAAVYWVGQWKFGNPEFRDAENVKEGDVLTFKFFVWKPGLVAKLPQPDRGFGLSLGYARVTDAGLKELARLKRLEELDLDAARVTDAGLKELVRLKELHALNLDATALTDAGLKELARLKKLRSLGLKQTGVTDAGLKELAGLKRLRSLGLGNTRVTDVGLKELAPLKRLRELDLSSTRVTDAGLKVLAQMERLEVLDLSDTGVTDGGLKALAGLKRLQSLVVARTKVTESGLVRAGLQAVAPSAKETRDRVRYLINVLASKNTAPAIKGNPRMGEDAVIRFSKKYDKSLQVPVYLALQQLLAEGEGAFDLLLAHTGDNRYSFSVNSISDYNVTVSEACRSIVWRNILCFEPELHILTRSQFGLYPKPGEARSLANWWRKNRHRGLANLQIEAIVASIAFFRKVDGKTAPPWHPEAERLPIKMFNRLREDNLRILKAIRQYIVDKGEPYRPKTLLRGWPNYLFGLPWTTRKINL
jgi:hypothetical protein